MAVSDPLPGHVPWRRTASSLAWVLAVSCSGPSVGVPPSALTPDSARGSRAVDAGTARAEPAGRVTEAAGAAVLALPRADDVAIASIGDTEIKKSQVFDALLELIPAQVASAVDVLILDAQLAPLAERYGVHVPARDLDFALRRQWALVQRNFQRDHDPGQSFADWVEARHGKTVAELRQELEHHNARTLMRGYTLRYHLRRRGSMSLAYFQCESRRVAENCRARAAKGADLEQLILSKSTHESRRRRGLLPPLPLDHESPVVAALRSAKVGELSPVITIERKDGRKSFAFARVVARTEPDTRPFADVVDELGSDLERRPVQPYEFLLFGLESNTLESRSRGR